jgi:hypothetical protein
MKLITILVLFLFCHFTSHCQILEPVRWEFSKTKIDNTTYKINLRAKIKPSWHVYSQLQPPNAIAMPLQITFERNNLISLIGKPKEIGKMLKVYDASIKVGAWQYSNSLDLIQVIKLKKPSKTTIEGYVTFQVCNDKQCLAPEDKNFKITLN